MCGHWNIKETECDFVGSTVFMLVILYYTHASYAGGPSLASTQRDYSNGYVWLLKGKFDSSTLPHATSFPINIS
jgi:hypothetical protein